MTIATPGQSPPTHLFSPLYGWGKLSQTCCAPNYTMAKCCFVAEKIMSHYLQLQILLTVGKFWNKLLFNTSLHIILENKGHGSSEHERVKSRFHFLAFQFLSAINKLVTHVLYCDNNLLRSIYYKKDFCKVQNLWQLLQHNDIYS